MIRASFSHRIVVPCALAAAIAMPVCAQSYPAKPLRLIVPFGSGGGTDVIGRALALKLGDALGQQVVVDNRPGANGTIGVDLVAKAPPDGHALAMITSSHTVNVSLYRNLPYDLVNDLAPVVQVTSQPYMLVIHPSLPAKTVAELVALARAKPGAINYASSGIGGLGHLSAALFAQQTGAQLTHVPYKGGTQGVTDLIAGHVHMLFSTILQANPQVRAGRLRALAVTSPQRSGAVPTLPTMQEAGVAGYAVTGWYAIVAPARTPAAVIARLNGEINTILRQPEIRERLAADGSEAAGGGADALGAHVKAEIAKWAKLVRETGIRAE
jgi:tripartite-type tricarboxylate transporter receptor subunit TctC